MKWFFVGLIAIATLFLINGYAAKAWSAGFMVPIGEHGFQMPWAVCLLGGVVVLAIVKIKTK